MKAEGCGGDVGTCASGTYHSHSRRLGLLFFLEQRADVDQLGDTTLGTLPRDLDYSRDPRQNEIMHP